eukprot:2668172-Rhodomonas_salina.1
MLLPAFCAMRDYGPTAYGATRVLCGYGATHIAVLTQLIVLRQMRAARNEQRGRGQVLPHVRGCPISSTHIPVLTSLARPWPNACARPVSYTHLRAHETEADL